MLTKLLFTVLVIFVIVLIYSAGFRNTVKNRTLSLQASNDRQKKSHWAIYLVAAILALGSVGFFFYKWNVDHTVVTIRIVAGNEDLVDTYKAYRKDIKGRTFTTLDGRIVTLGDSDRIELLED